MSLPERIETARLVLRRPALRDLEAYVAYATGPRTGGVGGARPRHVAAERFLAMAGQWALRGHGRYVLTERGTEDAAGFGHAGVLHADPAEPAEITWTLWEGAREGLGFATEAARAVLSAWAGPPLLARVAPENAGSRRVAARLGLREAPDAPPPGHGLPVVSYVAPA